MKVVGRRLGEAVDVDVEGAVSALDPLVWDSAETAEAAIANR